MKTILTLFVCDLQAAEKQAGEMPGETAGEFAGGSGSVPNLSGLMSDPEVAAAFQVSGAE